MKFGLFATFFLFGSAIVSHWTRNELNLAGIAIPSWYEGAFLLSPIIFILLTLVFNIKSLPFPLIIPACAAFLAMFIGPVYLIANANSESTLEAMNLIKGEKK
jgi:uncharacterized membrane protein YhdT